MRTSTATTSSRPTREGRCARRVLGPAPGRASGLTLLEVTVVLTVLAVAAAIALPRLADVGALAVDVAGRRLADAATLGRDRAILSGRPVRLVLDLDAGRWTLGGETTALQTGVRLRAVATGADVVHSGVATLAFDPAGDPLPMRIDLADGRGHAACVILPPAGARVRVTR